MTGIVVKSDETGTGVKIAPYTGTAPLVPADSTFTIHYYSSTSTSDACTKDVKKEEAKKEEAERDRVKKMREGWKAIRKGHEYKR